MTSMLGHHMNKSVLVSIPSIFGNTEPRHCRLVGIETAGLWLESDHFSRLVGGSSDAPPALVFVPFSQIGCLAGAPAAAAPSAVASVGARTETSRLRRTTRDTAPRKKSR
jgi:hypothetical protein